MNSATSGDGARPASAKSILRPKRLAKRVALPIVVFGAAAWFLPKLTLFYVVCGLYDVCRNRGMNADLFRRYFLGNGVLLWLLSPFNILMDLLCLPFVNKGVYRIEDLPPGWQADVRRLVELARSENLAEKLEERAREFPRTMIFFKWYGVNVDTFLDIPGFHEPWNYIQTIGVSAFNKNVATSRHFGYVRPTLRVLYSLNDINDRSAYINVGDHTSYWCDNKLFIFDDTLLHQSINGADKTRYCLFVDMIRPSPIPALMSAAVKVVRLLSSGFNFVFYKNWKVIAR